MKIDTTTAPDINHHLIAKETMVSPARYESYGTYNELPVSEWRAHVTDTSWVSIKIDEDSLTDPNQIAFIACNDEGDRMEDCVFWAVSQALEWGGFASPTVEQCSRRLFTIMISFHSWLTLCKDEQIDLWKQYRAAQES